MATYGYCRVSTERQAEEGESLGAQERTIRGYAMMNELGVDAMFIERGVSGSKPLSERPEGARLLQAVKPGDVIITSKLDRMFRSALDALDVLNDLKVKGVSLHMVDMQGDVTTNGISKLVFTILSAVAEAERDRIRERVRDVKRDQRKRGRYLGGTIPFGWKRGADGSLIKDALEQGAIKRMVALKSRGISLRTIARAMKDSGHEITHAGVRKVISSAEA